MCFVFMLFVMEFLFISYIFKLVRVLSIWFTLATLKSEYVCYYFSFIIDNTQIRFYVTYRRLSKSCFVFPRPRDWAYLSVSLVDSESYKMLSRANQRPIAVHLNQEHWQLKLWYTQQQNDAGKRLLFATRLL